VSTDGNWHLTHQYYGGGGWKVEKYNEILANIENMVNVAMADSDDESNQNKGETNVVKTTSYV